MEGQTGVRTRILLVLVASICVSAEVKQSYFLDGSELELRPSPAVSGPISNVLWKHNGNLLAEWVKDVVELTYYGSFNGRATLDPGTGILVIQKMTSADQGAYTVEINNAVYGSSYDVKLIQRVTKPEVLIQPLACSPQSEKCTASCREATAEAEPVEYWWMMGDGEWKQMTALIDIIKSETTSVKSFSCRLQNPVSKEDSEPKDNPFFTEEDPASSGLGGGAVAVIVIFVILAAAGVVLGLLWKTKPDLFNRGSHPVNDGPANENGSGSPPGVEGTGLLGKPSSQPNTEGSV